MQAMLGNTVEKGFHTEGPMEVAGEDWRARKISRCSWHQGPPDAHGTRAQRKPDRQDAKVWPETLPCLLGVGA